MLRILAWPLTSGNPYIGDLYERIQTADPAVSVAAFSPLHSWRTQADVVHVHWPDAAANSPSLLKAGAKTAAVLGSLMALKRRGAKVVWTCHNLSSHDVPHPSVDRVMDRRFKALVDGTIHLTETSRQSVADDPMLGRLPTVVVPHGHFGHLSTNPPTKEQARAALTLDEATPTIGFVGMIRPYKNVPSLLTAFAAMNRRCQLIVGGNPLNAEVLANVSSAADQVSDQALLRIDTRWLSDEEVVTRVRAADVVVLPYQEVHNSGVAVLALGLERPVAVNPTGSMATLGQSVGEDWVYNVNHPIDGAQLDAVIDWATKNRTNRPDMTDFDPDVAARRTLDFYRRLSTAAST